LQTLSQTDLSGLPLLARGKVRDLYIVGDALLLVATDRISAFDHVLATGIPGKGKILTQLSLFWFDLLRDVVPNHLIAADVREFPASLQPYADELRDRSMLVKRAHMFPVECVVRGYLSGSGWKDYKAHGTVCGIALPKDLKESDRLPAPLFTPASKSLQGEHDENISYEEMATRIGEPAAAYAAERGVILADTKFEFGTTPADGVVLADEVLTPDSSRYWPASEYAPGGPQPSFDKQFVRDYLEKINWNKQAPAPPLPEDVVVKTQQKYLDVYRLLTGKELEL
jgi:phosphoribosylaminoimidazole-succinocarboxamide synthase